MCDRHAAVANPGRYTRVCQAEQQWVEPRISRSLINQYPDVYWLTIFTLFESSIRSLGLPIVAAFFDCHGFVPEAYHLAEEDAYPYRTQERPRLRQLWNQFATAQGRVPYVAPADEIELPERLSSIWPPTGFVVGDRPLTVRFDRMHALLLNEISNFRNFVVEPANQAQLPQPAPNGPREPPRYENRKAFTPRPVLQTRLSYYLTLYEWFRYEVADLRRIARQIITFVVPPAITVQDHVHHAMADLQNDPLLRGRVYQGLVLLLAQSLKFRDLYRHVAILPDYLQSIGVYDRAWDDWWPDIPDMRDLENYYDTGYHCLAENRFGNDPAIRDFLFAVCIITPNAVTNGQLVEFLVDTIVEYAEGQAWSADRAQARDLARLDHMRDTTAAAQVNQFDVFDPIQVRSRIIWLCLIRYPAEKFRYERNHAYQYQGAYGYEPAYL